VKFAAVPDGLQSDLQLNSLGLRLEFMVPVLFQHGAPDVIVQWIKIWSVWGNDSSQRTQGSLLEANPE